jgi:hypothetical protein
MTGSDWQEGAASGGLPSGERRRAQRYRIEANATVRKDGGEPIPATVLNISASGILLRLGGRILLEPGEAVTVEVELPGDSDKPLSPWGIGRIVRVDGDRSAIQLCAGSFHPLPAQPETPSLDPDGKATASGRRKRRRRDQTSPGSTLR